MSHITKSLNEWLRDSLRSGLLFGRHDEPLDAYGQRIVRVILTELEAVQPTQGAASALDPSQEILDLVAEYTDAHWTGPECSDIRAIIGRVLASLRAAPQPSAVPPQMCSCGTTLVCPDIGCDLRKSSAVPASSWRQIEKMIEDWIWKSRQVRLYDSFARQAFKACADELAAAIPPVSLGVGRQMTDDDDTR